MTIAKHQVEALAALYRQREDLQKNRERADRNFWLGVINESFGGTGTRHSVLNAIGGTGDFAALLTQACSDRFEQMQKNIDEQIVSLGGEP